MHEQLLQLTLLVAAAVGSQWLAATLRVPGILLLLAMGILIGPVTGIFDPRQMMGDWMGTIVQVAVALILFEGGLSLHVTEMRVAGRPLIRLLISGLVLGSVLTTLAGVYLGGLSWATAAVAGGILVVTGPTVILPMLRTARIPLRPASLLKWEGIVNDPLGALLAYVLFKIAVATGGIGQEDIVTMVLTLVGTGLASTLLGVVVGFLLDKLLDHELIQAHLKSPVMLAAVLLVFTGAELLGEENGLLAVTAMGLVLANVQNPHVDEIRHFKEQISTLLIGFLFLVLSAGLEPTSLGALVGSPLLVVGAVLFLIRPIVVLVATARSAIPWSERVLVGWIGPRGVVAAAVAGAFAPRLKEAGYPDADLLVPLIFGVIISTVVLHSLSLRPLARWLGLSAGNRGAVLLVGASTMAIELARTLARAGAEVVLTDARFHKVSRARREGVDVHHGDVLSEEMAFELPLERLALMVAASDDDSYNALVCMRFHAYLPRSRVVQITPANDGADRKHAESRAKGETPWGERATYRDMTRLFWQGYTFKVTLLTDAFGIDALRERNPDSIPLFAVVDGKVEPIEAGAAVAVGAKVLHFAPPEA